MPSSTSAVIRVSSNWNNFILKNIEKYSWINRCNFLSRWGFGNGTLETDEGRKSSYVVRLLATNSSHRPADCLEVPMMSVYVHFSDTVFITQNLSAGEIQPSFSINVFLKSRNANLVVSCGFACTWTQVLF
jgi:hypothetical protein